MSERAQRWGAGLGALGLCAGVLIIALDRSLSPVPEWAGTALLLLGLRSLWPRLRGPLQRLHALDLHRREAFPYLLIAAVGVWALWPLPIGTPPISQDHGHHYLATRILIDDLLPNGHIFGFTNRVSIGLPFGDVYNSGAYLLTASPHLLSFGLISVPASYALGLFVGWVSAAFAVLAWTRRLTGGWIAPTLAAALFMLDIGGSRQGGWYYSMFLGVWPQYVGTGLWMWTLLLMVRLAEQPSVRRLALPVIVGGAAFWCHAFNSFNLLVAALALVAVYLHSQPQPEEADPRVGAFWMIPAFGLAALIGLGWMRRLMEMDKASVVPHQANWGNTGDLVLDLLQGQLFANQLALVGILGLVGLVVLLLRRRRLDVVTLLILCGLTLIAGQDLVNFADLGLHPGHRVLQYPRFSISMKPLFYAAVGVGALALIEAARGLGGERAPLTAAARVVLLVLAAPLVWTALAKLPEVLRGPAAQILTAERAGVGEDIDALRELLIEEASRLGPDRPHRVAVDRSSADGPYELFAIADAGFGYLPNKLPPAQVFKHINARRTASGWRWLGASLVIDRNKKPPVAGTQKIRSTPHFEVQRLQGKPTWPALIKGEGRAEVLEWSSMSIRLKLSGTTPTSQLLLGIPPIDKWQATLADEPVELVLARGPGGYASLRPLQLSDGELRVDYVDPPSQAWGLRLSGALVLLGLLALFFRRPLPAWPPERWRGKAVVGATAFGALLTAVIVFGALGGREAGRRAHWLGHAEGELVATLHQQEPLEVRIRPRDMCVRPFSRNPRPECDPADYAPQLFSGYRVKGKRTVPPCMRFGVPARGSTEVVVALPQEGDALIGRLTAKKKKAKLRGQLVVGDRVVRFKGDQKRFELPLLPGDTQASLRFTAGAKDLFGCLEVGVVRR